MWKNIVRRRESIKIDFVHGLFFSLTHASKASLSLSLLAILQKTQCKKSWRFRKEKVFLNIFNNNWGLALYQIKQK